MPQHDRQPDGDDAVDWERVRVLRDMCARWPERDRWPEMLTMFLADAQERVSRLGEAVDAGDPDLVCELAHSLKGSSATFGTPALRGLCNRMEILAGEGDLGAAPELVRGLRLECDRVRTVLAPTAGPMRTPRLSRPARRDGFASDLTTSAGLTPAEMEDAG